MGLGRGWLRLTGGDGHGGTIDRSGTSCRAGAAQAQVVSNSANATHFLSMLRSDVLADGVLCGGELVAEADGFCVGLVELTGPARVALGDTAVMGLANSAVVPRPY